MTYCLAISVNDGIVFASDTRFNAGVDYVARYRKLHVIQPAPDRIFVLQAAGSLATTQELRDRLARDLEADDGRTSLATVEYLFEAAIYIGQLSAEIRHRHKNLDEGCAPQTAATFILGGQVGADTPQIFIICPEGNYIRASADTPFVQIGESKYGKPMLDRLVSPHLSLEAAARLALVSLDASQRSDLTVSPPFDFLIYRKDSFHASDTVRIDADDQYYRALRDHWHQGLSNLFKDLPPFDRVLE